MYSKLYLVLLTLILVLHHRLWFADDGVARVLELKQEVAHSKKVTVGLSERNALLKAEVDDLRHHFEAVEERARTELGMIQPGETFYQYNFETR